MNSQPRLLTASRPEEHKVRGRGWVWLLVLTLIGGWLALSGLGGPYFGKISEVATNDQSTFLPASAESTEVTDRLGEFRTGEGVPAIIIATRDGGLEPDDQSWAESFAADAEAAAVDDLSPPIPSSDGEALQLIVPVSEDDTEAGVDQLRQLASDTAPDALAVFVTGPAGFSADLAEAFSGIDGMLLIVAVFVILIIVYRSPIIPVFVLLTALAALASSIVVVYLLADAGFITVNGQVQGILFILVVGATTDYCLLFVARFRDELSAVPEAPGPERRRTVWRAWKGTIEPILASGGTVIAGLLCLLVSDLASTQALGPVAAIGIAMGLAAALTFLPALLFAVGPVVFWPFIPGRGKRRDTMENHGLWSRIAAAVTARPRITWITVSLLLAVPLLGITQLKADGVPQSEFVLGASQARDGQDALGQHFPSGSGSPAYVLLDEDAVDDAVDALDPISGIDALALSADSPTGLIPLGDATDDAGLQSGPPGEPIVSDGDVLINATLADPPDSQEAEDTVVEMRQALADARLLTAVGGEPAVALDSNEAAKHDRALAMPLILIVVTIVLVLLLRSLLAPLLLMFTTVLSFGTAMGVSALVFNHVLGFPGADPTVPLFAFVFLVALGIDYNIFLMSRVREESMAARDTRTGVVRGLVTTGGVITSAGIVLAATFAALAVLPIMFLVQLAFIVAFGVLLDAIVVRSLLVPGLFCDLGRATWWPWMRSFTRRS
ncbi:MMPL family transporter [Brevibacterium sp. UBA7493]|uniref:MMPL family transporter n=1 Tax=Brevibacterium sp. UBA7493 TaxID=1946121 RepID=UPI0025798DF0|nr:MMPL family transporter [Brevibacterium sp. UBA7493]